MDVGKQKFGGNPSHVPLLLDSISPPSFLSEFLQNTYPDQILNGRAMLREPDLSDTSNPTLLGRLELDLAIHKVGLNVSYNFDNGVITQIHSDGQVDCKFGDRCKNSKSRQVKPLRTIFQICSTHGGSVFLSGTYFRQQVTATP